MLSCSEAHCFAVKHQTLDKFDFQKFTESLLWVHRPPKPTIDFLEMPTPMEESLWILVRLDVNHNLKSYIHMQRKIRN